MDRLRDVLGRKSGHLARLLQTRAGLDGAVAARFVQVAGADLIESYHWQKADMDRRAVSDPSISRDLLGGASATRIADELGLSRAQVWQALRTFVPRVLELANAVPSDLPGPRSMALAGRWSRTLTAQVPALLQPMD